MLTRESAELGVEWPRKVLESVIENSMCNARERVGLMRWKQLFLNYPTMLPHRAILGARCECRGIINHVGHYRC